LPFAQFTLGEVGIEMLVMRLRLTVTLTGPYALLVNMTINIKWRELGF